MTDSFFPVLLVSVLSLDGSDDDFLTAEMLKRRLDREPSEDSTIRSDTMDGETSGIKRKICHLKRKILKTI